MTNLRINPNNLSCIIEDFQYAQHCVQKMRKKLGLRKYQEYYVGTNPELDRLIENAVRYSAKMDAVYEINRGLYRAAIAVHRIDGKYMKKHGYQISLSRAALECIMNYYVKNED